MAAARDKITATFYPLLYPLLSALIAHNWF